MKVIHRLVVALLAVVLGLGGLSVAPEAQADTGSDALRWSSDTIYVEDHANSRWPVWSSAEKMDNGSPLNLVVVRNCPSGKPCIKVHSVSSLPGRTVGRTNWSYRVREEHILRATVRLDNSWGRNQSYRMRKNVVMHEIGHAVGLGHSGSRSSIMYKFAQSKTSLSKADRRAINRRY